MNLDNGVIPRPSGDGFISAAITNNKMQMGFGFKLNKVRFSLTLRKYDHALNVLKEVPLSNGERVYGPLPPMLRYICGQLCLVYYQFNSAEENSNLTIMAAAVDTSTLTLQNARELFVLDQKNYGIFKADDFFQLHRLIINESPGGSAWMAVWNSGLDNEVRINVLSNGFQSLWTKKVNPGNGQSIKIYDGCLDTAEKVYLSYTSEIDKNTMEGHILVIQEKGAVTDRQLRMTDGYPYEVRLAPSPGQPFINVVGTYVGAGALSGVYSSRLNTGSYSMDAVKITPAPDPVLEDFKKDSWARTSRKEHGFLPITMEARTLADGSVDMIGEFRRTEMGTKAVFILSGDVLWVHFAGAQVFFNRIPKIRVSAENTIGDSYKAVKWKDRTLVFYNDTEKNLKKDLADEPSRSDEYKDLVLAGAAMTPDGKIKRELVANLTNDNYLALTKQIENLSSSSFLVYFVRIKGLGGVTSDIKLAKVDVE